MRLPKKEFRQIVLFLKQCGIVCNIRQDDKVTYLAGIEWTNSSPTLIINPRSWKGLALMPKEEMDVAQKRLTCSKKGILLHEIGHLKTDNGSKEAGSLKEYRAQKWAIEYASRNRWDDIVEYEASHIRFWNLISLYHSSNRIYKMAYRLFLKDRKWLKKYRVAL